MGAAFPVASCAKTQLPQWPQQPRRQPQASSAWEPLWAHRQGLIQRHLLAALNMPTHWKFRMPVFDKAVCNLRQYRPRVCKLCPVIMQILAICPQIPETYRQNRHISPEGIIIKNRHVWRSSNRISSDRRPLIRPLSVSAMGPEAEMARIMTGNTSSLIS